MAVFNPSLFGVLQVDMVQAILDPDYFINALDLCRDNLARLHSSSDLLVGFEPSTTPPAM